MLVNDGPDDDDDRGDGVAGQDPQVAADVVGAEVDDAAHGVSRGAVGQGRADGPPERREQRGLVGAARAGVAEDDEEQDRDADAYDAEQGLEGQGDGADREDQQGAEPPQGYQGPVSAPRTGPTTMAPASPETIAYEPKAISRLRARRVVAGRAPEVMPSSAATR